IDATKYNHPECVKYLLVHHANSNHKNHSSISALILAAELGYFECVKLLAQAGADLKLFSSIRLNLCGQTSLFCAAKEDRTDIIKYLLDDEANRHVQNHYGVSALCIPSQKGILRVVELLLNDGTETHVAPFDSQADELNITVTKFSLTSFLLACEICNLDIIEAGADFNYEASDSEADNLKCNSSNRIFFVAILNNRVDVAKFLIEKGARINVHNCYSVSSLLLCTESGDQELVQVLPEATANINITQQAESAEENFLAGHVKTLSYFCCCTDQLNFLLTLTFREL
ncbi:unnamed protein product, partial [Rotaria sordida]